MSTKTPISTKNKTLVDKYTPTKLSELFISPKNKKIIKDWISNFKKSPKTAKKVLLITGSTGVGKSTMARLIFQHYKYRFIEFDSVDLKLKKSVKTLFNNSFQYDNVINMFNEGKSPSGILIDEIEILLNNKIEKNNVMKKLIKLLKLDKKNKFNIKYPIICTFSPFSNKNLTLLKKYSDIIRLNKPSSYQLNKFIEKMSKIEKFKIDFDASLMIINYAEGDISRLIKLLELILVNTKKIKLKDTDKIMKIFLAKKCNLQLFDIVKLFVNKKLNDDLIINFYLQDTMLLPLMFYDNIGQCILTKKITNNKKMIECIECCCDYDILQNYIIKKQCFDFSLMNSFNLIRLNYLIDKYKNNKFISNIKFAKILTKTSLFYSKRKKKSSMYHADIDLINEIKSVYKKNNRRIKIGEY